MRKGLNSFETISYGSDAIVDGNNKINAGLNELNEKNCITRDIT